jgi:4-amino-4-deoxy-L-arabinose transferase-like glycosyltransferase
MRFYVPYGWLLVFLLAFLLLSAGGHIAPQDEETTFRMTAGLVESGRMDITEQYFTLAPQTFAGFLPVKQPRVTLTTWAVPGRDSLKYPQFMPGQAILNVPLYLLGRWLSGEPLNLRSVRLVRWTTSLFNSIVIALTAWLIALFAGRLGYSQRLSVGLGLAYALCTMALPYTGTYFSEPLIALLILLAAYAVYAARAPAHVMGWLAAAGTALGLAVFSRERSAILILPFVVYLYLWRRRVWWRGWAAFFAPLIVSGVVVGLLNWSRYGSPLTFGFSALQHTSFTTPLLLGLYGLLISPGKGLLLYNPIAWAGLIGLAIMFRTRRREAILFTLIMLAELLFFAGYEFWTGGWNWGPRYILPVLPLLVLAAGEWVRVHPTRFRKTVLVALCLIGFVLNLPAVLVDHSRYLVSFGERDPQHYLSRSILNLADSPLTQQWPMVFEVASLYARPAAWRAAQRAVDQQLDAYSGDGTLESLSTHALWFDEFFRFNAPDFWFIQLPWLGFSPVSVGLFALALLIVTLFSAWKVWLMLR